jgi:hypothetical protein
MTRMVCLGYMGVTAQSETARGRRRSAHELLGEPDAYLTRSHLRELGWERRAVDSIFRALPIVVVPGYTRPHVKVSDYLELVEQSTYRDDRVRPMKTSPAAQVGNRLAAVGAASSGAR